MQKKSGITSHFFTANMTMPEKLIKKRQKKGWAFRLILSFDISYTKLFLSVKFA